MPLSLRAYAKHRGVSLAAVQKAIKSGRIKTLPDGKVDPELADSQWKLRTRASMQKRPLVSDASGGAAGKMRVDAAISASDSDDADAIPNVNDGDYYEAQKQHEWEKVRRARMVRRQREGELVEVSEIKVEWGRLIAACRSAALMMPDKIAKKVAVTSDTRECRAIISRAVNEFLSAMSEYKPNE